MAVKEEREREREREREASEEGFWEGGVRGRGVGGLKEGGEGEQRKGLGEGYWGGAGVAGEC